MRVRGRRSHQPRTWLPARAGELPPADANVKLFAETLEGSNVNSVDAMINMISVARQFEMQIKMLQMADANAAKASQLLSMNQ